MRNFIAKPATLLIGLLVFAALVAVRSASAGDATSRDGCMNQWLFNGVWRVQVTKVEPYMDGTQQKGWLVTEVWRNGTSQELAPGDSLLQDQKLTLDHGSIAASATSLGSMSLSSIASHSFANSGQFTYTQLFNAGTADPTNKPKAIDITFDGPKLATFPSRPHFTSHQYNFHFKLDCQAGGGAAQAEGGSGQVSASAGCLNEWLSNGVWRMRATAIAPDNDLGGAQVGWKVTEDWMNLSHQSITPGDTSITDQQLVLTSGNNIASSAGVISSGSFASLAYHAFAPAGSFTYQQQFLNIPLNAADTPVKLVVTFDAARESKLANKPHYKNPANFRINLTCSK